MSGWSHDKRLRIEKAFYEFLDHCFIYSKDISGQICLGKELYDGQIVFITEVFDERWDLFDKCGGEGKCLEGL